MWQRDSEPRSLNPPYPASDRSVRPAHAPPGVTHQLTACRNRVQSGCRWGLRMSLRGQPGPVPGADVAGASPLAGNVAAALPWVPREYPESTLECCAPQGTGTHPPSHSPSPGYPEYLLSAERRKRPARIRLRTHPLSHAPSSLRSRQRTSPAMNVVVAFVAVVESVTRAVAAAVRAIGAPE